MPIPAGLTNFLKPANLITRGLGVAALGVVLSDAHYVGKVQSDLYASEKDANSCLYYLNNDMYSTNMSKFEYSIREASYNMELNQGYKRFFNVGIGYIKGFTSMLGNHILPLLFGIGAVCGSKLAAVGVAAVGIYKFVKNFFGIGTPNGLTR